MKGKVLAAIRAAAAWTASLFVAREVGVVWRMEGRWHRMRAFQRGRIVSARIPMISGAAFEVLQTTLPAVAAAVGTTTPAVLGEIPMQESEASFSDFRADVTAPSLVTGNSTNSATINLVQRRAGAVVTTNSQSGGVFASLALVTGTNLNAGQPVAMSVVGNPVLLPGDEVEVQVVQIGTGLALPAGTKVDLEIG